MRKHFQMTEEVLALMLERRKLAGAGSTSAPTQPQATAPGSAGGSQGGGAMQGGMGGMRGGMMQREMGGMQGGGMMQKEMGGMQGGTMPGMGAASPATTPSPTTAEMDQLMRRITEHSTYMETVTNPSTFQSEMLRHQKMLDQMMQLMQR
jgi:hypothetical protein